jgi:uncharacterized membrane protein HdeD (DUF308 family)
MTTATAPVSAERAPAMALTLRNLYFVRFGFAIVWAALVFVTGHTLGPASITLLVLYPLFDVAAAIVDHRASKGSRSSALLYVNMALSVLAAIGLAIAVTSGLPAVLAVWGAWAITAGAVQLIVALTRRGLGGQWAMILSGGISVLAGASFILQSTGPSASLTGPAGYAVLGAIFFIISAIRLRRATMHAKIS